MNIEQVVTELFSFMEERPRKIAQHWFEEFGRGELFLLNYLYNNGGSASPSTMRDALQTSTARIAAALHSLEQKGWVKREYDGSDGRRKIVYLTPKGKDHVEKHIDKARLHITKIMKALGEEDANEYLRIIKKMEVISREIKFD